MNLQPEPGFVDILMKLHSSLKPKENQSIRHGTEFTLKECGYKKVQKNLRNLKQIINNGMEFQGIWSSLIPPGGFRVKHNHPKGEISGCWYLEIDGGSPLYFDDHYIIPNKGDIVLFPSHLTHWVEKSNVLRLTIAFDMVKNA